MRKMRIYVDFMLLFSYDMCIDNDNEKGNTEWT